ncbi:5-oxoprolinase subunit PxpA [Maribacter algicola]|uniref:5-oxoprolinase subunit PxpA n=1 Tax=Meishania litoralis TaxID=3434685 RepID=A0ACC7LJQ0_9FLAO
MNEFYIDINCDVGEGVGNEALLLPLISSCNIACGGHAGNQESMFKIARMAHENGVKVGAHPSYPDRINFGRVSLDISEKELIASIRGQLASFARVLKNEKIELHHIKPHGALYNDVAKNKGLAQVLLSAIEEFKKLAILYVPYKSVIEQEAHEKGFKLKREAFADRSYNDDLSLVPRKLPGSVIHEPEKVLQHLLDMVRSNKVTTLKGEKIEILADTYCIHGDTPFALEILDYLTQELPKAGIRIKK